MLHLHDLTKQDKQIKSLILTERLPNYLSVPCHVNVTYQVEAKDKFYLIHLNVTGELNIICQRCVKEFSFPYENQTEIAVCRNDERAEQLLEHYECIVSSTGEVELEDLIIDELHLYAPLFHPLIDDCDSEILEILTTKNETY